MFCLNIHFKDGREFFFCYDTFPSRVQVFVIWFTHNYVRPTKGRGTYCFWCGSCWHQRSRDCKIPHTSDWAETSWEESWQYQNWSNGLVLIPKMAAILKFVKQCVGSHLEICQVTCWQPSWNLSNNMVAAILKFFNISRTLCWMEFKLDGSHHGNIRSQNCYKPCHNQSHPGEGFWPTWPSWLT